MNKEKIIKIKKLDLIFMWTMRIYHAIMIFLMTWMLFGEKPNNITGWISKGINVMVLIILIFIWVWLEKIQFSHLKELNENNGCFSCGNKPTKTYFNLNYYNSITTNYEPVYLCNSSNCKYYLLNILENKDCSSHSQFTNIASIPPREWDFYKKYLNDHDI